MKSELIDWKSPEVESATFLVFFQLLVFSLGLFGWHVVLSFPLIEGSLLTRRLKFSWVFIPYLFGRYALLATFTTLVMTTRRTTPLNCELAYQCLSILGNLVVTCASGNLSIRTYVLWKNSRLVCILLIVMATIQFVAAIYLGSNDLTTKWDPTVSACRNVSTYGQGKVVAFYLYTCLWDFMILVLTAVALTRAPEASGSVVWKTLYKQGISYFLVTFGLNVIIVTFSWLKLNDMMNVIFTVPGSAISMMISSNAVTSLIKLKDAPRSSLPSQRTNERIETETPIAFTTFNSLYPESSEDVESQGLESSSTSRAEHSVTAEPASESPSHIRISFPPSKGMSTVTSRHMQVAQTVDQPIMSFAELQAISEQYSPPL